MEPNTKVTTATATVTSRGKLSRIVDEWTEANLSRARAAGSSPADWEALAEFVAVDEFQRVGAYLEVFGWEDYKKFLSQWAGTTRFECTVFRMTEVGRVVFQEIEERHYRGEEFIRKNVIAVFEFNDADKIRHLDIYEQARDTGQWIVQAAKDASAGTSAS